MSIFSRLFKVGEAHASRVLDKIEKPELMLDQALKDKEKEIRSAREKVQAVIATERSSKSLIDKARLEKEQWEERAQYALSHNNEDLAAKALVRAEECEKNVANLNPSWTQQRDSVVDLKNALKQMEDDLNELKRNKDILIAQAKTAEVKKSIYEAKASIGRNNKTSDLIARMKAKAERQTFEAEAAEELAQTTSDDLETQFTQLGGEKNQVSSSIKNRLEAMKKEMNQ